MSHDHELRTAMTVSAPRMVLNAVETVLMIVSILILIALALGVSADVLLRALKLGSNEATSQLSSYAMLMLTFFPAPWVLRHGQQIDADLLKSYLSAAAWQRLQKVTYCLGAAICMVATSGAVLYVNQLRLNEVMDRNAFEVPRWIPLLPMPIGFALLSLEFCSMAYRGFRQTRQQVVGL